MKMRFETAGSIGQLGVLVIMALSLYPWEARKVEKEKPIPCEDEIAVIEHWTSMNLIRDTKQNGKNLNFFVYDRAWAALPRSTQVQIGSAAYCRIALAGKGGIARINDLQGKELARVAGGKWSSWQFPE